MLIVNEEAYPNLSNVLYIGIMTNTFKVQMKVKCWFGPSYFTKKSIFFYNWIKEHFLLHF